MSSRDKILGRIRAALTAVPGPAMMPDAPTVWPTGNLSPADLCREFETSLAAVGGETVVCHSKEEAAQRIEALLKESDARKIGIANRKIVAETLALGGHGATVLPSDGFRDGTPDFERYFAPEIASDASPQEIATLDASVIGAEYLLADAGSAVVASANAFDRMLCYLPPVCCVVATEHMLREHLPAAWPEICTRTNGEQHGEFLIVTGPSRTADIEKILVMGVHGPKRLVVFIVADKDSF
jgi:L-lactate dehydrogenase complex protein LldG